MTSFDSYFKGKDFKSEFNQEKTLTSVWLVRRDRQELALFKCFSCGTPVLQYGGDVIQIVAGSSPTKFPFIVECRSKLCGNKFQFNGVV